MAAHDKSRVFSPPADGWFQIAPKGETLHRESGLTQVVDDQSIKSMVERFKSEAARPGFPGKLVDFDHYSDLTPDERAALEKTSIQLPSKAAGWIKDAEARPDGAYIKIDLTPDGQQALANGDYRFLSPVFRMADVEDLGNNRVRPLAFKKAGLTNEPRMKSIAALTNADKGESVIVGQLVDLRNADAPGHPFRGNQHGDGSEVSAYAAHMASAEALQTGSKDSHVKAAELHEQAADKFKERGKKKRASMHAANAAAHKAAADACEGEEEAEPEQLDNRAGSMKEILAALKLADGASEADAVAKIAELSNRCAEADKAALKAKVDGALAKYAGVIANREQAEARLTADFDGTVAALDLVKPAAAPKEEKPLLNRDGAKLPTEDVPAPSRMAQQAQKIAEIKNRDKCSGEEAFARAVASHPELFKPAQE